MSDPLIDQPQPEAPAVSAEALRYKAAHTHALDDAYVDLLGVGTEEEISARAERLGNLQDDMEELAAFRAARDAAPEDSDDGVESDDARLSKVRNEAKNLRLRLRDAEGERNGLRETLTAMQRVEAVQVASGTLSDGEDLFRSGVQLADLLSDDGTLDPRKVQEATAQVAALHPNWTPNRAISVLTPGIPQTDGIGWQKVLKG